jgi:hypothetical protein
MKRLPLLLGTALLVFALQLLYFYSGVSSPPPAEAYNASFIPISTLPVTPYEGERIWKGGLVLIDMAHENDLTEEELSPLLERIASRGAHARILRERKAWEESLQEARGLVLINPTKPPSLEEAAALQRFVERGGRLLLLSDPTRTSLINSFSSPFEIVFRGGYLYDLRENEGNYRYVSIRNWTPSEVTEGVRWVTLYVATSIDPSEDGIAFASPTTRSSEDRTREDLTPIVLREGKVLAVGDLTLFTPPYHTVRDNNRLLSNVVDFLLGGERIYTVSDFPHYFGKEVQIVLSNLSHLTEGIRLKALLEVGGRKGVLVVRNESGGDAIYVTPYSDLMEASRYLDAEGISLIGDRIRIRDLGEVPWADSSLVYLLQREDRTLLFLLFDKETDLEEALDRLEDGEIQRSLLTDALAYLPSPPASQQKKEPQDR